MLHDDTVFWFGLAAIFCAALIFFVGVIVGSLIW